MNQDTKTRAERLLLLNIASCTEVPGIEEQTLVAAIAVDAGTSQVTAAELLQALERAGYPGPEAAPAVRTYFTSLSALDMGRLFFSTYTQPPIGANDMKIALRAANYSDLDVETVLSTLYPVARTYRHEGPVGRLVGEAFDDFAQAKLNGQSVTRIVIRSGDIIDSIQSFIGGQATPQHGGNGGGVHELVIAGGDALVEVSGYYGYWYGQTYVLQLSLRTRANVTYGPFGNVPRSGTPFRFSAQSGEIVGFHGAHSLGRQANGSMSRFLSALGVVVKEGV